MPTTKKPLSPRQSILAKLLDTDLVQQVAHARKQAFNQGNDKPKKELQEECGLYAYSIAFSFLQSKYKKNERIKARVGDYINSQNCVFLTFTFRDDVLEKTTEETRRRYIARVLKKQCPQYVANIDFGNGGELREYTDNEGVIRETTAREHYHALAVLPEGVKRFDMSLWPYGFSLVKRVPAKDYLKVRNYVTKLTAHALKDYRQKPRRLIYSRD